MGKILDTYHKGFAQVKASSDKKKITVMDLTRKINESLPTKNKLEKRVAVIDKVSQAIGSFV